MRVARCVCCSPRLHRWLQVRRLLRSTRRLVVVTPPAEEVPDGDLDAEEQQRLYLLSWRAVALPVARGMFTMASVKPVLTDVLPIPPLVLTGVVPPKTTGIELDLAFLLVRSSSLRPPPTLAEFLTSPRAAQQTPNPEVFSQWPQFHNGVAAGLRVSPDQTEITRTWIVYNRPDQLNYSHAGFLMALGLHVSLAAPHQASCSSERRATWLPSRRPTSSGTSRRTTSPPPWLCCWEWLRRSAEP